MSANRRLTNINLVPQDEFERSFVGKALKWALSAGKSIVILTEFVVILAFLSRFKLDRDLNDLNEVIAQKQAVVESYSDVEEVIRGIESQVSVVQAAEEASVGVGKTYSKIQSITPGDVVYDSIQLDSDKLTLRGLAASETGFSKLVELMKADKAYSGVQLTGIELDNKRGGIGFTLIANKVSAAKTPTPVSNKPTENNL